jgi:hypothetical protein
MKYKCTNLIANLTYYLNQQIVYILTTKTCLKEWTKVDKVMSSLIRFSHDFASLDVSDWTF